MSYRAECVVLNNNWLVLNNKVGIPFFLFFNEFLWLSSPFFCTCLFTEGEGEKKRGKGRKRRARAQ